MNKFGFRDISTMVNIYDAAKKLYSEGHALMASVENPSVNETSRPFDDDGDGMYTDFKDFVFKIGEAIDVFKDKKY